jgi:hypothetical protein
MATSSGPVKIEGSSGRMVWLQFKLKFSFTVYTYMCIYIYKIATCIGGGRMWLK